MILSNVNIGTGPSAGDGDPLRSAFNTINYNFALLQANANATAQSTGVSSVAGRTGNVTITVNDVVGLNPTVYPNASTISTWITSNVANIVGSAPAILDTLAEISSAINDDANIATTLTTAITTANTNMKGYVDNAIASVPPGYADSDVKSYLTEFDGSIIPSADVTYNLGNVTHRWNDLYLNSSTIYLGDSTITTVDGAVVTAKGRTVANVLYANSASISTVTLSSPPISASSTYRIAWAYQMLDPAGPGDVGYQDFTPGNYTVAGTTLTLGSTVSIPFDSAGFWYAVELYSDTGAVSSADTVKTSNLSPIDSTITLTGHIIPDTDETYDLGSSSYKFGNLYLAGSTIYIGAETITESDVASWATETYVTTANVNLKGYVDAQIEVVTYDQDLNTTNDVTFANIVTSTGQLSVPTDTSFALRLNDSTYGEANLIVDSQGYMTLTGGITTRFYNVVKDGELIGGLGWNGNIVQLDALNGFNITTDVEGTGGVWSFGTDGSLSLPGGGLLGQVWDDGIDTELTLKSPPGVGDSGYVALSSANERNYVEVSNIGVVLGVEFDTEGFKSLTFGTDGSLTLPNGAVIKDNADSSVSFGGGAGATNQGIGAVAIGEGAGNNTQSNQAVAIGRGSGNYQQGVGAIGVGFCAGATEQGDYAVAIGFKAARGNMDGDGTPNQPANSIMINASSTPLNGDQAGLYINPVREDTGNIAKAIYYNTITKELTYADPTGGGGDVLTSDNANITVTIANTVTPGNTLIWTFDTDGFVNLSTGGIIGDIFGEGMTGIQADPSDPSAYVSLVSGDKQQAVDASNDEVIIWADDDAQGGTLTKQWKFNRDGEMVFPDGTIQTTAWNSNANAAIIGYVDSAVSTANVAAYTGNISAQVNGYDIGYRDIPQVTAGNVTLALADRGKHYYSTSSAPLTLTVPSNANVAFPVGTAITIVNKGTANLTVDFEVEASMYLAGNATSASRTITTYGMATVMKTATDEWFINGTGVV